MSKLPGSNPPPSSGQSSQPAPPPYQSQQNVYPALPAQSTANRQAPAYTPRLAPDGLPPDPPSYQASPDYTNNNFNHGEASNLAAPAANERQNFSKASVEFNWVQATPITASQLSDRAVIGGYEASGSPLWVIRAKHKGAWIPGKLSIRTNVASIAFNGKEMFVQAIEVLCARPENLQWVPGNKGNVPPNAVVGGKTSLGMTLYVGRATFQKTVIPGNIFPWKKCCNIGFGGKIVTLQVYEVLCRIR